MAEKLVGLDKGNEKAFTGLVAELASVKGIVVGAEETAGRLYVTVGSVSEADLCAAVERAVYNAVLRLKLKWFEERISSDSEGYVITALLLALLFFEEAEERATILGAVNLSANIVNVDGIFNFRMGNFKDNWEEAVALVANLIALAAEEEDILSAATFLTASEGGGSTILIYSINNRIILKNVLTGAEVALRRLFDEAERDVLATVISARPNKLIISGDVLSDELLSVLKHFAKIKKACD